MSLTYMGETIGKEEVEVERATMEEEDGIVEIKIEREDGIKDLMSGIRRKE